MKDHCLGEISKRRDAQPRYAVKIQHIVDAIVAAGYLSLDSQAKALGVKRSTAWTIIKTKHKLDRLSGKTTDRMLANPELPPSVRTVIQRYLAERSGGRKPRQRQNLLTPGLTEQPDCRCGTEMRLFKAEKKMRGFVVVG